MQTNFLNTPINPNLAHNVRTLFVGAHRVRPQFQILICRGDLTHKPRTNLHQSESSHRGEGGCEQRKLKNFIK